MHLPKPQEIYRHFKGKYYQVITLAVHSETGEEMVVYQALYGDFAIYCRPLWMFVSPVDKAKYPNAGQEYRFERMQKRSEEIRMKPVKPAMPGVLSKGEEEMPTAPQPEAVPARTPVTAADDCAGMQSSGIMGKSIEEEARELNLNPLVVAFLDADTPDKRLQILDELHRDITDDQIDLMAMALDFKIPEGDVYDRYLSLRDLLLTKKRFESGRLRG